MKIILLIIVVLLNCYCERMADYKCNSEEFEGVKYRTIECMRHTKDTSCYYISITITCPKRKQGE